MTTSLEWISKVAPSINTDFSDEDKSLFISMAADEVDPAIFDDTSKYNLAVAYYACHLMALSQRDANSRGFLTSEKEGDLSRSYGGGNSSNSEMNTTQYLDNYHRFLKSRVPIFHMQNGYYTA